MIKVKHPWSQRLSRSKSNKYKLSYGSVLTWAEQFYHLSTTQRSRPEVWFNLWEDKTQTWGDQQQLGEVHTIERPDYKWVWTGRTEQVNWSTNRSDGETHQICGRYQVEKHRNTL